MSGHSKWANIKQKKGKADAARGHLFTKIGREIVVAVKEGGGDPALNAKLRDVIAKAKAANMPNDNISRSIKRATGELGSVNYESVVYEGYGPGGIAIIVEALTDNRNRTAGEVRHIFDKHGGSLGQTGSVSYLFKRVGIIICENTMPEDDMMMLALDFGAEDIITDEEVYEIHTDSSKVYEIAEKLKEAGCSVLSQESTMISDNEIDPTGHAQTIQKMLDAFDDNDDVQNVYHNAVLKGDEEE